MAGARTKKNKADPYVLANAVYGARTHNPMKFVVVSNEGRGNRQKLPPAAQVYDIECLQLLEMLAREVPDGRGRAKSQKIDSSNSHAS
jgi:hypothetical protein